MVVKLDKRFLLDTFGVGDFDALAFSITSMAPSLAEYYLSSVCSNCEDSFINKRNIANSIYCGQYSILIDYSDDVFLEYESSDSYEEQSLF